MFAIYICVMNRAFVFEVSFIILNILQADTYTRARVHTHRQTHTHTHARITDPLTDYC